MSRPMPTVAEQCGFLIKGNPARPCVNRSGHKDRAHQDMATRQSKRIRDSLNANRDPEYIRSRNLILRFGISSADYDTMLASQTGRCAICRVVPGDTDSRLSVDHDHACCPGRRSCGSCIRGLLCNDCNLILGNAKDSVVILRAAIDYLGNRVLKSMGYEE